MVDNKPSPQYKFSEKDGTLSITLYGDMPYYYQNGTDSRPWKDYQDSIRHIVLSDSVTSISNSAFQGCTGLESVSFGNGLRSIGELAFRDCSALESLYIPDSVEEIKVTSIYEGPFFNCTGLKEISVGGVETVTSGMFRTGSQQLEKLTIRGTVKTIGGSAFDSVVSYRSGSGWVGTNGYDYTPSHSTALVIEEGVETIMWYAFNYCKMFTSITIPESVQEIQTHAFTNCTRVSEVIIPENATKVEDAFAGVNGIKVYPYSSGLASVRAGNLDYSVIPYNNTMILPTELHEIGREAFAGADCEAVVFPDTLSNIGTKAFIGCDLRVCVFNNGDTVIDEGAFGNTEHLRFACDPSSQVALWAASHGIPVTSCMSGS